MMVLFIFQKLKNKDTYFDVWNSIIKKLELEVLIVKLWLAMDLVNQLLNKEVYFDIKKLGSDC